MEETITMKENEMATATANDSATATKVCKVCGEELPITKFRLTKNGTIADTCMPCIAAKSQETKRLRRMGGAVRSAHDPFTMRTSRANNPSRSFSL